MHVTLVAMALGAAPPVSVLATVQVVDTPRTQLWQGPVHPIALNVTLVDMVPEAAPTVCARAAATAVGTLRRQLLLDLQHLTASHAMQVGSVQMGVR